MGSGSAEDAFLDAGAGERCVVVLNDAYTPMDFVVRVLKEVMYMDYESAVEQMLAVHERGRGNCGTFEASVAAEKVASTNARARRQEYPLLCVTEPVAGDDG